MFLLKLIAVSVLFIAAAHPAQGHRGHLGARFLPLMPAISIAEDHKVSVKSFMGETLPPPDTIYYFDQLIDHADPSQGTFKQRYFHSREFYERGGPVILVTPGETNIASYYVHLSNSSIFGQIAQREKGAVVIMEHRFFGLSNPKPDLSVESLKYLTIQQAIDDFEYFAKNVELPQPDGDHVAPGQAPWVLAGGSYSGALTGFTMVNKPGLFQAAYASSAVVETILDFWQYFEPIRQFMPQNCSADLQAVIAHIDSVFTSGTEAEIDSIKATFGLADVPHLDDVARALTFDLGGWQGLSPTSNGGPFYDFCDALEIKDGMIANSSGWGVEHALPAWGAYFSSVTLPEECGETSVADCTSSYDLTLTTWSNTSVDNFERSWLWIVCNEVGWFQNSAPADHPTLVSRLLHPAYDERLCTNFFPEAFPRDGPLPVPDVDKTNTVYHGWFVQENHLFFANGLRDPWRGATLAADGTHFKSTAGQPLALSEGFHCSDLSTKNGLADPSVLAVQQQGLDAISGWLKEWKPSA